MEYNKLVRPQVIKESTNRPNIRYVVTREKGAGTLVEKAARLVQSCWPRRTSLIIGKTRSFCIAGPETRQAS